MKYYLSEIINIEQKDISLIIEIIDYKQFVEKYCELPHNTNILKHFKEDKYCRVDLYYDGYDGLIRVMDKANSGDFYSFGFCLIEEKLVLVDDDNNVMNLIKQIKVEYYNKHVSLSCFLQFLIVKIIEDDGIYLQKYLDELELIEDQIDSDFNAQINVSIMKIRKKLLSLRSYYNQLSNIINVFCDNETDFLSLYECHMFNMLARKIERLENQVKSLDDYSLHIKEMCQSKIDAKQNKIMTFLTVATSLFFPLSIVTGWYGMNFIYMPELTNKYGYIIVIIVSALIILVEMYIFKKKKFF